MTLWATRAKSLFRAISHWGGHVKVVPIDFMFENRSGVDLEVSVEQIGPMTIKIMMLKREDRSSQTIAVPANGFVIPIVR
jgi:hypothetical protein